MENNSTNKQSIIGFILIGLVFFGYMLYNNYQMEKYNEQLALEQAAEAIATQASEQIAAQNAAAIAQNQPQEAAPEVDPFIINAETEEQVTIENDYLRLTLSSVGGQIVDATLKQHTKYAPKQERNELVKLFGGEDPAKVAVELKNQGYTLHEQNLTPSSDYITYLGYKTTNNKSRALTDIRLAYAHNEKQYTENQLHIQLPPFINFITNSN